MSESTGKTQGARKSRRNHERDREPAELVTLAISVLLLAGVVGGLIVLELTGGHAPARLEVRPDFDRSFEHDGTWYLPVTVTNSGDEPTDKVQVSLERPVDGELPEVADLEFDFVAGGEQVEGFAAFQEEPTTDSIEIDVESYTVP